MIKNTIQLTSKFAAILSWLLLFWQGQSYANELVSNNFTVKSNVIERLPTDKHKVTAKQANALAAIATELNDKKASLHERSFKTVQASITELKDSTGLVYLGAVINNADITSYLAQMSQHLGSEFTYYREQQAKRDHHQFHMTLVNPYEYQTIDKNKLAEVKRMPTNRINIELLGLGKVSSGNKTSYFVVAKSSAGQLFRQQWLLKPKDFHITLGFNPQDVYGVSKGIDTLLKP